MAIGRFGDRISVGGNIFRIRPDRPWGVHSLLYNGYRGFSFAGGKRPGHGVNQSLAPSAKIKNEDIYSINLLLTYCGITFTFICWGEERKFGAHCRQKLFKSSGSYSVCELIISLRFRKFCFCSQIRRYIYIYISMLK